MAAGKPNGQTTENMMVGMGDLDAPGKMPYRSSMATCHHPKRTAITK
jgi:hypothetical protein